MATKSLGHIEDAITYLYRALGFELNFHFLTLQTAVIGPLLHVVGLLLPRILQFRCQDLG